MEKNLACRRVFEQINYSKESIEIRLKGGVSDSYFAEASKDKSAVGNEKFAGSEVQKSVPGWNRTTIFGFGGQHPIRWATGTK